MTAKEHLLELRRLEAMIDEKMQEVRELEEMAESVRGLKYDKENVQTSPTGDPPYQKYVEKISDLSYEIAEDIDHFAERREEIIREIHELSDTRYVQVLYLRYVKYESYEKIAVDLNYSYDHVKRLHAKALREFERCHSVPR